MGGWNGCAFIAVPKPCSSPASHSLAVVLTSAWFAALTTLLVVFLVAAEPLLPCVPAVTEKMKKSNQQPIEATTVFVHEKIIF